MVSIFTFSAMIFLCSRHWARSSRILACKKLSSSLLLYVYC